MSKTATLLLLLTCSLVLSCHRIHKSELQEAAYWNNQFIDSSYRLLYKNSDTNAALRYYDAHFQDKKNTFPKAARFGLKANYHYFFSHDDRQTALNIDSALACFPTTDLQDQYPQAYVGYLLFGGKIAYRLGQYNKANEYYFKAKELADAHLSPCDRKEFNYNIAMLLYQQQNFDGSLHYFQEAYDLQATCYPQTWGRILQQQEIQSNIGLCFIKLHAYDSALVHFDNALQIANQYKDSLGPVMLDKIYGVIYGNKAKVFTAQNRLEEAVTLSKQSIALNYRKGYEVEDAMEVKMQLADIYDQEKKLNSMYAILSEVRDTIQHFDPLPKMEWRRLMSSYYDQTAQPALAFQYYKQYTSLRDSLAIMQKQLADADVTRQLKDNEQKLQIIRLKRDNQLALVFLLVAIIIFCMAIAIISLIYQNYRRSKKNLMVSLELNEEIRRQKEAREEEARQRHQLITKAVIRAQEKERSIIGLELHDNINQVLTTVKLQNEMALEGIGDSSVLLTRSVKYLQDCINEIRSLSKRLSAPTLGKISLQESVKDLVNSINLTSKVSITHQVSGFDQQPMKQELHLGLYRILQEQLNNVLKHAEASEVFVSLEQKNEQVYLLIEDNGKGFHIKSSKNGIGLMNMQTRAENLNGTFTVNSKPGKGCKVEVVVPV